MTRRLQQLLPAMPFSLPLSLARACAAAAAHSPSHRVLGRDCCYLAARHSQVASPLASPFFHRAAYSTTTSSVSTFAPPSAPAVASLSAQSAAAGSDAGAAFVTRLRLRDRLRLRLLEGRRRWRDYGVLAVAGAGCLLVASQAVDLVLFLDSIHHLHRLELAFLSGGVVVAASLLLFSAARRCIPLHVPPLYRLCLRRLRQDAALQRSLGSQLTFGRGGPSSPSGFRVVSLLPSAPRWQRGAASVQYWGWERYWKPRRAQLLMTVRGERGSGVVLAEMDNKLDGRRRIRWLTVEQIVSTAEAEGRERVEDREKVEDGQQQPRSPQLRRLALEQDGSGWSADARQSYRR